MSTLVDDVDEKIEKRMNDLDLRAEAAEYKINSLSPLLEKLERGLEYADNMLANHLLRGIKVCMFSGISQAHVTDYLTPGISRFRRFRSRERGTPGENATGTTERCGR
jgi:hypothetical protein